MSKLVVKQEIFGRLLDLVPLPGDELESVKISLAAIQIPWRTNLILERLQNRSSTSGTVDENQSQAPAGMGHSKTSQYIGTSSLTQANDVFHMEEIQNGHQILAKRFQRWKNEAEIDCVIHFSRERTVNDSPIREICSVVFMATNIDVNETRTLLDLRHARAAHEVLERIVCNSKGMSYF